MHGAERVARERGERLGQSVGYHVRLASVFPQWPGCIVYGTTGWLLRYMQQAPTLGSITTLIVDEVHERYLSTDVLLALLRDILPRSPRCCMSMGLFRAICVVAFLCPCPRVDMCPFPRVRLCSFVIVCVLSG